MRDYIRIYVNYEELYKSLFGPGIIVTNNDIREALYAQTGMKFGSVNQVITTLTLHYPIWSPKLGTYKIIEDSDYDNYCEGEED